MDPARAGSNFFAYADARVTVGVDARGQSWVLIEMDAEANSNRLLPVNVDIDANGKRTMTSDWIQHHFIWRSTYPVYVKCMPGAPPPRGTNTTARPISSKGPFYFTRDADYLRHWDTYLSTPQMRPNRVSNRISR